MRALLGEPMLLLLESPLRRGLWTEDLAGPLLAALAEAPSAASEVADGAGSGAQSTADR